MRWTKLKKEIESRFAPSVKGRVHLHSTQYGSGTTYSRGWITIDGKEVVNFSTADSVNQFGAYYNEVTVPIRSVATHPPVADELRTEGNVVEKGEFSRFDFHESCWAFYNQPIDESFRSENPIIRGLAILDARIGMRRLNAIKDTSMHPFPKLMLSLRLNGKERE